MFEKGWNRTTLLYVIGMVFSGPIIIVILIVIFFPTSSNPPDGIDCGVVHIGEDGTEYVIKVGMVGNLYLSRKPPFKCGVLGVFDSRPITAHDMGDGVHCYTFNTNIACLQVDR